MSSYRHSKQLRRTSRINILVLLMSLVLLNGHCAAAYASAQSLSQMPEHHVMGDASKMAMMDHHSQPSADCNEMHEADPASSLITSSLKLHKDKQDDLKPLLALLGTLPESRAGPVISELVNCSAEYPSPPLYYSLCVLRL